jgi:peptidoglycan hydrolase CwlO-like protein
MPRYKIDLNREHASLLSSVEVEKTRLQGRQKSFIDNSGERATLSEKAAVIDQMMNNVKNAQLDIDTVRNNLREAQAQLTEANKERDSLQLHCRELQLKVSEIF